VIGRLTGIAIDKSLDGHCVLDVHGVGYELSLPLRSVARLPAPPELVTLQVHTYVREDTLRLYGFESVLDRAAFRAMLAVTGVGPKLALAILGDMEALEVSAAIARGDKKRFSAISGIGAKMAERLVLELKDKLPEAPSASFGEAIPAARAAGGANVAGRGGEVVSALVGLGFTRPQAEAAVAQVVEPDEARPVEALLRKALATFA
jgi:Holliday junction DNA helicase RuvA